MTHHIWPWAAPPPHGGPSEVIGPESYQPHVWAWWQRCKDLSISQSVEEMGNAAPSSTPRGRWMWEGGGLSCHACGFYCETSPFFSADRVSDSRRGSSGIYWQLRVCRWWANAAGERGSCKRQRAGDSVKRVFISVARPIKLLLYTSFLFFTGLVMAFVLWKSSVFSHLPLMRRIFFSFLKFLGTQLDFCPDTGQRCALSCCNLFNGSGSVRCRRTTKIISKKCSYCLC